MHPVHGDLIPRIQREVLPISPRTIHSTSMLVIMRTASCLERRKVWGNSDSYRERNVRERRDSLLALYFFLNGEGCIYSHSKVESVRTSVSEYREISECAGCCKIHECTSHVPLAIVISPNAYLVIVIILEWQNLGQ